jgi:rhodanese-related sulfurtransferase
MNVIKPSELQKKLENGEPLRIIDVREEWEYEELNMGAINIPFYEMPQRLDEVRQLADQTLVLHCKTGSRSDKARRYLCSQGISNCISLEGGIEALLHLQESKEETSS